MATALVLALLATSAAALGPPVPMVLVAVDTIGSDSADFSLSSAPILAPVTGLRLKFLYPVALHADDLQLVEAGPDGRMDTRACAAFPSGDDRLVPLAALRDGVSAGEVAADFGAATGLPAGSYRFLFCEQIAWPAVRRDFTIAETGWLDNPNFSTGISGWQAAPWNGPDVRMTHSSLDADGSTVSGALRVHGAAGGSLLLYSESCMHAPDRPHRVRLRHRVLQGEVRIRAIVIAGFAGDQGDAPCIGPSIHQYSLATRSEPSPGFDTLDSDRLPPRAAPSAQLAIEVTNLGDAPFEVLLDDIGFSNDTQSVFVSSFD